ncbi:HK97-gp10 family putative phage morphogenesis protein [Consotaella salsifontis]|uniref:Phage protein, HK97 gp10 family n=1 Tax=Consotaella salsifontis TaxID=1365950 RepID=A0A1T4ST23_9HYPH|nr:HK97-gp10 family putative phage morphogenesis protein [Consotaella salsifontis]SKA31028.1 phage protein, HK97 gp10 family [Consotaella salsifontis]
MAVRGLASLKKKLARMPNEARKEIRKALDQGAYEIAETAASWAPVDSGDLKRSIGYTFGEYRAANANVRGVTGRSGASGDPDLSVTVHAGDEKAWYAALVEFGTAPHFVEKGAATVVGKIRRKVRGGGKQHPGTKPQPYFFPAYRANKKRIKASIALATKRAAQKVANS